jgi:hypothetical protein
MMSDKKAVALFGDKETMPAHIAHGSGLGNENVGADDVAMPYLNILQALSPEVEEMDGAKAGMFLNSITKDLYEWVFAVNLYYSREYTIFRKRQLGGGFEGSFSAESEAREKIATQLDGKFDDYDITETHRHVLLLLDKDGTPLQPVIMNLSGSKLRPSRAWNAEISVKCQGADRFAAVWKLSTVKQSNNKGSWYNLATQFAGWAPESLYDEAKKYYTQVAKAA